MKRLGRAHREEFFGLASGAAVGILAVAVLAVIWRRRPLAARAFATAGLASATTLLLGMWHIAGRSGPAIVGCGIAWLMLAAALVLVFMRPGGGRKGQSLAWLRVPSSPGSGGGRGSRGKGVGPKTSGDRNGGRERGAARGDLVRADELADEALAALEAGDVDAAVAGLRGAIELRATKRSHTLLGTVLGARGEKEGALAELDRALALDPAYGEALDEKARVLEELGRPEEAAALRDEQRVRAARGGAARGGEREGEREGETAGATRLPDLSRAGRRAERLAGAGRSSSLAPWIPAAAFSAAVVAGSLLSLVYAWGKECLAARAVIAVLDEANQGLSAPPGGRAPSAAELDRRRLEILEANPFTRNRAASLKAALALHAYGRVKELATAEKLQGAGPELSRWAAGWAKRRIAEARAALEAGDRTRLPVGLAKAFTAQREGFEIELERRRRRARSGTDGPAQAVVAAPERPPGEQIVRDWRRIWRRPAPGTTFRIEAFRRTSLTASAVRSVVGNHRDGSPLEAAGLLRCTVAPSPGGVPSPEERPAGRGGAAEDESSFVLLVESLPFEVKAGAGATSEPPGRLGRDRSGADLKPGGIPPKVRLVPKRVKEGKGRERAGTRFRIEFGPRLDFRSLVSLGGGDGSEGNKGDGPEGNKGGEKLILSRDDLYSAREIPLKSLPLFAPGLSPDWEEDESYLWPYPSSPDQAAGRDVPRDRGPSIKQVTYWRETDGVTKLRVGWRMRYSRKTREYTEQVVQAWTLLGGKGRPWWDFYDDGVLFFRTALPSEQDDPGEGGRR